MRRKLYTRSWQLRNPGPRLCQDKKRRHFVAVERGCARRSLFRRSYKVPRLKLLQRVRREGAATHAVSLNLCTWVEMVYEWDSKEGECYQLYVEEKKSLDEVMQQMKDLHGFSPR